MDNNLWNDVDQAFLRAKQVLGSKLVLPTEKDSLEIGLMRMVECINLLCDNINSRNLITLK